jgi:GTP cyclohydrolase I
MGCSLSKAEAVNLMASISDEIQMVTIPDRKNTYNRDWQPSWERLLEQAISEMLRYPPYREGIDGKHLIDTPKRVVAAYKEYFSGCEVNVERLLLSAQFPSEGYSQMIHVRDVVFYSVCAHHYALITGKVHFAYVPGSSIIGLSKIPRLVEAFARRPQVQENMTEQIVENFMKYVMPKGCGVFVRADHACMQCRGVRSQSAVTETLAMRGTFMSNDLTRQEFLMAVRSR